MLDFISQPWHWAVSGFAISLLVLIMTWLGRHFGVSSSFEVICAAATPSKKFSYFDIDFKDNYWRIAFVLGGIVGGYLAANYLGSPEPVAISDATIMHLKDWNIIYPVTIEEGRGFLPEMFNLGNTKAILLAIGGGILIGFGTRYAGGCTSGHAITGLSHLQIPSLIAVIGFFIGGLLMTHVIMPFIFG